MSPRIARWAVALVVLLIGVAVSPASASASASAAGVANPDDMLTYEPYGLVHDLHSAAKVDGYLSDLNQYGIGAAFLQTPHLKNSGVLRVPHSDRTMLARWSKRAAAYNTAHGTHVTVTAVFNGQVKTTGAGLDLDNPVTRANVIDGIRSVLTSGVSGVHLDFEPFPMTHGYLLLLKEIDAMFAQVGFQGRLSVVASGFATKWTPSYLRRVSQRVSQIDPMYYDSEYKTPAAYEAWIQDSLAYYTAHTSRATRIIPVIPSYSGNRWHRPTVENIGTATSALSAALASGSRVNGAGIWWWWGLLRRGRSVRRVRRSRRLAVDHRHPPVHAVTAHQGCLCNAAAMPTGHGPQSVDTRARVSIAPGGSGLAGESATGWDQAGEWRQRWQR